MNRVHGARNYMHYLLPRTVSQLILQLGQNNLAFFCLQDAANEEECNTAEPNTGLAVDNCIASQAVYNLFMFRLQVLDISDQHAGKANGKSNGVYVT